MELVATFAATFFFQVALCIFCFLKKTQDSREAKAWGIRSAQLQTKG
jgi:hypothetical protein